MTSRIFDQPSVPRLFALLDDVRQGAIQIPDFQRPFSWDDDRRLQLFDSVSKGIPIGSLLVWRTKVELRTYPSLGGIVLPRSAPGALQTYLIDGHQRLTTLFAALMASSEALSAEDGSLWPIYCDLTGEDGVTFQTWRGGGTPPPTWLPLNLLFSPKGVFDFQKDLFKIGLESAATRAEELANAFKDYQVPVVPLVTEDLDVATDSFVRINSGGLQMRESYMVQALAYSRYPLRDRMVELRTRLGELGWGELDDQVLVNGLKVRWGLDVYGAKPRDLVEHFELDAGTAFTTVMDELERDIKAAITLLRDFGIFGPKSLPYAYQLIALAETARRQSKAVQPTLGEPLGRLSRVLVNWFWTTTYAGYFTGMTGNRIREAIEHLSDVVEGRAQAHQPPHLVTTVSAHGRFHFRAVRTKAALLRLALHAAEKEGGATSDSLVALGSLGVAAVQKIEQALRGDHPASRVVIATEDLPALRAALHDPNHPERGPLLARHLIPEAAAQALAGGDHDAFLHLRGEALRKMEGRFVKRLGLTLDSEGG